MRLLKCTDFTLENWDNPLNRPPYVTFSHRWGPQEVLFDDIQELPHASDFKLLRDHIYRLEKELDELKETKRDGLGRILFGTASGGSHATAETAKTREAETTDRLRRARAKKGWSKIEGCCKMALRLGYSYVWIDTCCIDKSSSTELSEAINSMFSFYAGSSVCIAYLDDVHCTADLDYLDKDTEETSKCDSESEERIKESLAAVRGTSREFYRFDDSEWFMRGWTLQELIAPPDVLFYDAKWEIIGTRSSLTAKISQITRIDPEILSPSKGAYFEAPITARLQKFSLATRLSWAAVRKTTREEDRSYSLLGLLNVNIPIIYGEGGVAAFSRLQREAFTSSADHSIFAWKDTGLILPLKEREDLFRASSICNSARYDIQKQFSVPLESVDSLFATSPEYFRYATHVSEAPYREPVYGTDKTGSRTSISHEPIKITTQPTYSSASHELRVQLPLEPLYRLDTVVGRHGVFLAHLACKISDGTRLAIFLQSPAPGVYQRLSPDDIFSVGESEFLVSTTPFEDIYLSRPKSTPRTYNVFNHFVGKFKVCVTVDNHQMYGPWPVRASIGTEFTYLRELESFISDRHLPTIPKRADEVLFTLCEGFRSKIDESEEKVLIQLFDQSFGIPYWDISIVDLELTRRTMIELPADKDIVQAIRHAIHPTAVEVAPKTPWLPRKRTSMNSKALTMQLLSGKVLVVNAIYQPPKIGENISTINVHVKLNPRNRV